MAEEDPIAKRLLDYPEPADTEEDAAVHEAGHALMAAARGLKLGTIAVYPAPAADFRLNWAGRTVNEDSADTTTEHVVDSALAGIAAELVVTGREPEDEDTDWEDARIALSQDSSGLGESQEYLQGRFEIVAEECRGHVEGIRRFAGEILASNKRLDARRAADLASEHFDLTVEPLLWSRLELDRRLDNVQMTAGGKDAEELAAHIEFARAFIGDLEGEAAPLPE